MDGETQQAEQKVESEKPKNVAMTGGPVLVVNDVNVLVAPGIPRAGNGFVAYLRTFRGIANTAIVIMPKSYLIHPRKSKFAQGVAKLLEKTRGVSGFAWDQQGWIALSVKDLVEYVESTAGADNEQGTVE